MGTFVSFIRWNLGVLFLFDDCRDSCLVRRNNLAATDSGKLDSVRQLFGVLGVDF